MNMFLNIFESMLLKINKNKQKPVYFLITLSGDYIKMNTQDFEFIKDILENKCIYKIDKILRDDVGNTTNKIPSSYNGIFRIYLRSNISDNQSGNPSDNLSNYHSLYNKYILDCYFNYKRLIFQTSDGLSIDYEILINKKIKKIEKVETNDYRSLRQYYQIETTDNDTYRLMTSIIGLTYEIITIKTTVANPITKNNYSQNNILVI